MLNLKKPIRKFAGLGIEFYQEPTVPIGYICNSLIFPLNNYKTSFRNGLKLHQTLASASKLAKWWQPTDSTSEFKGNIPSPE
jgi:hypothetical protein